MRASLVEVELSRDVFSQQWGGEFTAYCTKLFADCRRSSICCDRPYFSRGEIGVPGGNYVPRSGWDQVGVGSGFQVEAGVQKCVCACVDQ